MQKIFSSTMAAIGMQLKHSVKVFQSLMLYRRLPVFRTLERNQIRVNKYNAMENDVLCDSDTHTFVIESVDAIDRRAFVVPAQEEKVLWILDFVSKEQTDGLQTLLSTVDIVAQEEVVRVWRESTIFEQTQKIIILPMNVACVRACVCE